LALFHRRRTIDGKSSWMQPVTYAYIFETRRFPRSTGTRMLQALGVKYLVLHADEYDPERKRRTLQWLDNRGASYQRRFASGEHYVYEVMPPRDQQATLRDAPKLPKGVKPIPSNELSARGSMAYQMSAPFDGNPKTRWRTRHNQQPGNWFEIVW